MRKKKTGRGTEKEGARERVRDEEKERGIERERQRDSREVIRAGIVRTAHGVYTQHELVRVGIE